MKNFLHFSTHPALIVIIYIHLMNIVSPAPGDFLRRLRVPTWSELYGWVPESAQCLSTPSLVPGEVSLTSLLWLQGIQALTLSTVGR
jgi:hypothetical protein